MGGEITHEATQTFGSAQISSVQYQPTDRPIEDRFSINLDGARLILGVYDGHGGSDTADHISKTLPLVLLSSPPEDHSRIFEAADAAMLDAFMADHAPLRARSKHWRHHAQVLRSGCTALILDIRLDAPERALQYANAGDCRALVCGAPASGSDTVEGAVRRVQQTEDLNAKTPSEQARLRTEHLGEELLVVSGRLFGKLMSTRGFGDGYYKLPKGINNWRHKKYIDVLSSLDQGSGKVPLNAQYASYFYGYHTPPYIVASPKVGTMSLTRQSFVVCGSDGLFDLATSEEVAAIVERGIADGVENLAGYLLAAVKAIQMPGDDVTILVVRFMD